MKHSLLLILCFFLINIGFAQNMHITYIGDIYTISLKQAANKKSETHYSVEKGYHHILVFKDKKAITFQQDTIVTNADSIPKILSDYQFLSLFDKKSGSAKYITSRYSAKSKRVYISEHGSQIWRKITPDKKPDLTGTEEEWIKSIYKQLDSLPQWEAPIYQYSDSVKIIHGYSCKNVNVKSGKREYNVWFTEEMYYNWCFDDYRFLIPGTVIYIECNNKPYLEFVSIEDLDYEKISIERKMVKEVLKKW